MIGQNLSEPKNRHVVYHNPCAYFSDGYSVLKLILTNYFRLMANTRTGNQSSVALREYKKK